MRAFLRHAIFGASLALLASPVGAQVLNNNIPANTVLGRIGAGQAGPVEAIPFASLQALFAGQTITLNSDNGQTAPGAMAGGNTYSFGATTDTVQMKGFGLGGTAPSTGLEIYNAAVAPTGNG